MMTERQKTMIERITERIESGNIPAWCKPWESNPKAYPNAIDAPQKVDEILNRYYRAEHIQVAEIEGDRAFYSPANDSIILPLKRQFMSAETYAGALAHETIHSTGDYIRCDRPTFSEFTTFTFGDSKYTREELVAEIGACFLLDALGIDTEHQINNATAYIGNWISQIGNNTRWITKAGDLASDAVDYILETAGVE